MPALDLAGIAKRFGALEVLRDLDLTVEDGELVTLLGPSGSGKTTALRIAAGLDGPDAGRVRIGGNEVTSIAPAERDVAMVFQGPSLFPHLNVRANIGFGLAARGRRGEDLRVAVEEAAALAGCEELLARTPDQLSGGESQRVALARGLARRAGVFLMDEPLSSLDAPVRAALRTEIRRVQRTIGGTMLYVTHDQDEAMLLGDRVAVLVDGSVRQIGTPDEVYAAPVDRPVAAFVGTPPITLLPCAADGGTLVAGPFRVPAEGAREATEIGVRPEDVRLIAPEGPSDAVVGRVVRVATTGSDRFATVAAEGVELLARFGPTVDVREDSVVHIASRPVRAHLFAADGRRLSTVEARR
ncbi:MAG: ABC transporter ATP-binding protein [Actinomycetota bacterium]